MKSKLAQNEQLAAAIGAHCAMYEVYLPADRKEYKADRARILRQDEYDDQLADLLEPLIKLHYSLKQTFGTYAEFGSDDKKRLVPLTFFYSRHRLDYAWNLRKSQLVRQRYADYLATATDADGRLLTAHYQPVHLTLTVPHQHGVFRGKTFYARELIEAFAELRKTAAWQELVYAGEYGLEVKRGKGNQHGLHIHTHSFILQHPAYTVNAARALLEAEWKRITGNTSKHPGLWYETLFTRKENKAGVWEKVHLVPGVSPLSEYTAGVMECIKYHFKPDCLTKVGGDFDLPLIMEILANTLNLRMYSRFGAFYKEPALSFNKLHDAKPAEELSAEALAEDVQASSDGVEERLVDPRTMRIAAPESYRLKVGNPLHLRYRGETSYQAREAYEAHGRSVPALLTAPPGLSLKQVIQFKVMGKLEAMCGLSAAELTEFVGACEQERAAAKKFKQLKTTKRLPTDSTAGPEHRGHRTPGRAK